MFTKLSTIIFFLSCSALLLAQSNTWSAQIQLGVGNYATMSDFKRDIRTQNGNSGGSFGSGNFSADRIMPYAAVQVSRQLNERWSVAPFVSFQYSKGDIFKDEVSIYGPTSQNPTAKIYTFPAMHELKVFTAGAYAIYRFKSSNKYNTYLGAGLAYMHRSHYYRELLEIDFTSDYTIVSMQETFITSRKSALGIPLTGGIDRNLSEHFSVGINVSAQVFPNLGDAQVYGGLTGSYVW